MHSKKGKVLSFGELLLRICPDMDGDWLNQNSLPFYVGGAEANVATALALWRVPSAYLTSIPDNLTSRQLVQYLNSQKIDTSKIIFGGERMGLYFLPKGKDLKNAGVIYDRKYSSFSQLQPGTIDWDSILEDVSWFNFSAISPAINADVAAVCKEALEAASRKNITISVDLNYRAKLWQYGKQPDEVMPGLVEYCHVIMGNVWAAEKMLGIAVGNHISEHSSKDEYLAQAQQTSKQILSNYPKAEVIANTFRFDRKPEGIKYYTTLYAKEELHVSPAYEADKIIDKVGSGDCFMGGLIYGLYNDLPYDEVLDFATAAAFQKLFIESDATDKTASEILNAKMNHVKN